MKINIYTPKAVKGEFSRIKLGAFLETETETLVNLNIEFRNLYSFTEQTSGRAFDLFIISALVYGIDVLIPREKYSIDGWSRELEVEFPVEEPKLWVKLKADLERLLKFLTGDLWSIAFIKRTESVLFIPKRYRKKKSDDPKNFQKVSLFSGGLDSLVGVIDQLAKTNEGLIFASHYDSIAKGPFSDQNKVSKILNRKYSSRFKLIQTRVDLDNNTNNGKKITHENSFRSRSFLFISLGIFIANKISSSTIVLIPENGTIALNHPLTPSRRSSCSTRTAHPYFLNSLSELISKLGLKILLKNEYEFMTKGEMLMQCSDQHILMSAYKESCSCAKRGSRKDIRDVKVGTNHCGVCMPCLYRRASLHTLKMDDEIYGTNIFNPLKKPLSKIQDIPAFIDYLKLPLALSDIEKNLIVNGSLPLNQIKEYARVIERTRKEIKNWIGDKGSQDIKNLVGI